MYNIRISRLTSEDHQELAEQWQTLEALSAQSFFLSWAWIGTWLAILPASTKCYLVSAFFDGKIVAFGIFCEKTVKRSGFVISKQWHLHRTGDEQLDQIWTEYNDFLCPTEHRQKVVPEILKEVANQCAPDEIFIEVAKYQNFRDLGLSFPDYSTSYENQEAGYSTLLNDIRNIEQFPKELSKSTFNHIKRTKKLLALESSNSLYFCRDSKEKLDSLFEYSHWHVKKWENTDTPSGFSNPSFRQFHQSLISNFENNIQVIKLIKQDETLALLYCFEYRKKIYFYLSCLKPLSDNKIKIGLLLHAETIKFAHAENYDEYDFMAGHQEYKTKLANHQIEFCRVLLSKKKLSLLIETLLKSIYTKLKKTTGR